MACPLCRVRRTPRWLLMRVVVVQSTSSVEITPVPPLTSEYEIRLSEYPYPLTDNTDPLFKTKTGIPGALATLDDTSRVT